MLRVYIAAGLANVAQQRALAEVLRNAGYELTYDWSVHGRITDLDQLKEAALCELMGVLLADVLIGLLPGSGRGTHTEIGIAIAGDVPVILWSDDPDVFEAESVKTSAFYHLPMVMQVVADKDRAVAAILVALMRFMDGTQEKGLSMN